MKQIFDKILLVISGIIGYLGLVAFYWWLAKPTTIKQMIFVIITSIIVLVVAPVVQAKVPQDKFYISRYESVAIGLVVGLILCIVLVRWLRI